MNNFYLIGLTGNLASGKSTVRRMLEELGATGIDADRLAHAAMLRGSPSWGAIVDAFGAGILRFNGKIDRQKLGAYVFANPAALQQLERILHPAVGELIKSTLKQTKPRVAVIEAIKLVEAGMDQWCDALWVVTSASDVQVARVSRDRQMRPEDARARLAVQGAQDEKLKRANVVIDNSHDLNTTLLQVQNAWNNTVHVDQARDKGAWLDTAAGPAPVTAPVLPREPTAPAAPAPVAVLEEVQLPSRTDTAAPEPILETQRELFQATRVEPAPPVEETPVEETMGTAPVEPFATAVETIPPIESTPLPEITEGTKIEVRRARRNDLDLLAVALARRENRTGPLPREQVMRAFGKRGYRIAVGQDRIIALAAWEAENLVAMVRDVWAESEPVAPRALPPLFALVEQDAQALQCEVSLVMVPPDAPAFILSQIRACGYRTQEMSSLHRLWRQVVEERKQPGDVLWVKRLREDMVTRPI